jgi:hypothetical protein
MPWQFAKYTRRSFQDLFFGMNYFFDMAKDYYDQIRAQDKSRPENFDQKLWMKEKTVSRGTFIMGMTGLEVFANNIIHDFSIRGKADLPKTLLNKSQRNQPIDRWKLADKIYFLPTICNNHLSPPATYFRRDSKAYRLFEELVEIRHSIIHGKPSPTLAIIQITGDKTNLVHDDFDFNYWPISRIHKDFVSFNYESAKIAYENINWVKDSLVEFIEKLTDKYLKEETIKLLKPVWADGKFDETDLIRDVQKLVDENDLKDIKL